MYFILQFINYDEAENRIFIRRLRRDDFFVNNDRLMLDIVNLVDPEIINKISNEVIKFEFFERFYARLDFFRVESQFYRVSLEKFRECFKFRYYTLVW